MKSQMYLSFVLFKTIIAEAPVGEIHIGRGLPAVKMSLDEELRLANSRSRNQEYPKVNKLSRCVALRQYQARASISKYSGYSPCKMSQNPSI